MELFTQKVILWTVVLVVLLIRAVETKLGNVVVTYGTHGIGNETVADDLQCLRSVGGFDGDVCPVGNTFNVSTSESTSVEAECIWVIGVWLMLKFF